MSPRKPAHTHRLLLFVAGDEPNSSRARANLSRIIAGHLDGSADLEVVNVLDDFRKAVDHGIFITPALVVTNPERSLTIYGDLSNEEQVLASVKPLLANANV